MPENKNDFLKGYYEAHVPIEFQKFPKPQNVIIEKTKKYSPEGNGTPVDLTVLRADEDTIFKEIVDVVEFIGNIFKKTTLPTRLDILNDCGLVTRGEISHIELGTISSEDLHDLLNNEDKIYLTERAEFISPFGKNEKQNKAMLFIGTPSYFPVRFDAIINEGYDCKINECSGGLLKKKVDTGTASNVLKINSGIYGNLSDVKPLEKEISRALLDLGYARP